MCSLNLFLRQFDTRSLELLTYLHTEMQTTLLIRLSLHSCSYIMPLMILPMKAHPLTLTYKYSYAKYCWLPILIFSQTFTIRHPNNCSNYAPDVAHYATIKWQYLRNIETRVALLVIYELEDCRRVEKMLENLLSRSILLVLSEIYTTCSAQIRKDICKNAKGQVF